MKVLNLLADHELEKALEVFRHRVNPKTLAAWADEIERTCQTTETQSREEHGTLTYRARGGRIQDVRKFLTPNAKGGR